jgi:hypothetical protein
MVKKKTVKEGVSKKHSKDFSNKTVALMLLLVIIVVLASLGVYLATLNEVNNSSVQKPSVVQQAIEQSPQVTGAVGIEVLPRPEKK